MASKVVLIVALLVCGSSAYVSRAKSARTVGDYLEDENKRLVDNYSCAGKEDGNYIHPTDCTKFMSCVAQTYAYERDCATCHVHPTDCPNGKTHYDHPSDACLWAWEAGCVIDSPVTEPTTTTTTEQTTTTTEAEPETEPPTTTTEKTTTTTEAEPEVTTDAQDDSSSSEEDPSCNPDECRVVGYCHEYEWCEREDSDHKGKGKAGTRKTDTCDPALNLYFNPNANSIHGGVCDFWENLDQETKDTYNADPNCIDPHCEWKPDAENECSSKYWYFHPEKNDGNDLELNCPSRPDGEQLLWDQSRKSCHTCDVVPSSSSANGFCC